jgi:hypothetical protein
MRDGVYDDAAAVTHMGNDVDSVDRMGWLFQEAFGNLVEVIVGMFMLWNELGWWSLTPLAVVICKCNRWHIIVILMVLGQLVMLTVVTFSMFPIRERCR